MAAGYAKMFLPLSQVKEKEFLSRRMGCKGVGFSFVRYKPGDGAAYVHRHKLQEEVFITLKGTGSIILDGKRISMPEGTMIRVAPRVYRALGNDSDRDVIYMISRRCAAKKLSSGQSDSSWGRDSQPQEGSALENAVAGSSFPELASSMCDDTAAHPASVSCAMRTSPSPSDENR